ncbi:phosphatase domain-containing protein, partial [Qipengyuania mesophila]|uniref:phosphatase domain-containing protein n=1 Tax=Qipengyuania mesophila TaxID=2867246 RepID=UPI0035146DF6
MGIFRRNPVRVQPFFGYRSRQRLILTGRTLRSRAPEFDTVGRWRSIRVMMSQFFANPVPQVRVTLCLTREDGQDFDFSAVSDDKGYFRFEIDLDGDWPYPEETAWEVVRLGWTVGEEHQSVIGHVLVPGADAQIGVISDIDDTIMETGITGGWHNVVRNWKRIFAQMPHERLLVEGADVFYGAIGGGLSVPSDAQPTGSFIPATHRPFFYISSSPWNLFSYLVAFKRSREMPLGALFLRSWGFNRDTIGKRSHGAHKQQAISQILDHFTDLRFAFIGDDTQGDLPAFAEAVAREPGRIAAVFIRTTEKALSDVELDAKRVIESFGVPLWLGNSYAVGRDFLKAAGVAPHGETSRIVETV